jgi:hypothetical protein
MQCMAEFLYYIASPQPSSTSGAKYSKIAKLLREAKLEITGTAQAVDLGNGVSEHIANQIMLAREGLEIIELEALKLRAWHEWQLRELELDKVDEEAAYAAGAPGLKATVEEVEAAL